MFSRVVKYHFSKDKPLLYVVREAWLTDNTAGEYAGERHPRRTPQPMGSSVCDAKNHLMSTAPSRAPTALGNSGGDWPARTASPATNFLGS